MTHWCLGLILLVGIDSAVSLSSGQRASNALSAQDAEAEAEIQEAECVGRETVTWGGKMPNAGRTEQLRITAIWMEQDGRWRQVARHANVVPAASSPR